MEVCLVFKKLIAVGVGIIGAAVSTLPAYACAGRGLGGVGLGGCGLGAIWTLPWTPFSWGLAIPLNPWSWW